jgi:hypothetical protein
MLDSNFSCKSIIAREYKIEISDIEAVREEVRRYIDGSCKGDAFGLIKDFTPNSLMSGYLEDAITIGTPEPL